MPTVAVVVPAFNAERFLGAALDSLRAQTLDDWTCVVVDDGSTDGTRAVAAEFAAHDPRIRVVSSENGGLSRARNLGLLLSDARAPFVFFLDADDVLDPDALRVLAAYLNAHPAVGLVGCQFVRIDAEGRPVRTGRLDTRNRHRTRRVPGRFGLPRDLRPDERRTPLVTFLLGTGQGSFALYRRSVLARCGLSDPRLNDGHQDTDLFARMCLLAEVHYLPDRLYRYRDHGASQTKRGARVRRAHDAFLAKWRAMQVDDPDRQDEIDAAFHYYDRVYVPLRHFGVSGLAVVDFLRTRKRRFIGWSARNFVHGVSKLMRRRG